MPIYEYRCENCSHQFEIDRPIKSKPLKKCPSCKKMKLESLLFAPQCFAEREAKTIGQLADRKAKKIGRYERDHFNKAAILSGQVERDKKRKEEKSLLHKISKMSASQKTRYIHEGS